MLALAAASVGLAINATSRRLDDCAAPFGPCTESKCCNAEPTYGCHKRHGKPFAQCRRVPAGGCDATDQAWQCPSTWEECTTEAYQNCWDTQCCANGNMACLRRGDRHFAQCRPMRDCQTEGTEWKCPGTWTGPQPLSARSPPPPPKVCSEPFQVRDAARPAAATTNAAGSPRRCMRAPRALHFF